MDESRSSLLKEYRIWKKKDDDLVPVRNMSDGHLVNTLRLLKRAAQSRHEYLQKLYLNAPPLLGEMAQDAFDREFDDLLEKDWKEFYDEDALDVLLSEAHKRGLQWESGIASLWV